MKHGTVEMVSVEWLMKNATDSIDGFGERETWDGPSISVNYERMLQEKATDYDFGHLVGTILTRGFRVPIVMAMNYYQTGDLMHGNGHHRMAAAILLCLDEIPVYWNDASIHRGYMFSETSDTESVETFFEWDSLEDELREVLF